MARICYPLFEHARASLQHVMVELIPTTVFGLLYPGIEKASGDSWKDKAWHNTKLSPKNYSHIEPKTCKNRPTWKTNSNSSSTRVGPSRKLFGIKSLLNLKSTGRKQMKKIFAGDSKKILPPEIIWFSAICRKETFAQLFFCFGENESNGDVSKLMPPLRILNLKLSWHCGGAGS